MYDIRFGNMSVLLNEARSAGLKVDCAKECPCGVPSIPVPDQWLEVMVTGSFKVWHIIFIIIALIITIIVVYCCFHRCRIPRTKQEIEADLMRTNLTDKFRDYLQEFPNEPTTFVDALKRVQELEEKAQENDDSSARKRLGWLKLKGKEKPEKPDGTSKANTEAAQEGGQAEKAETEAKEPQASVQAKKASRMDKKSAFAAKLKDQNKPLAGSLQDDNAEPEIAGSDQAGHNEAQSPEGDAAAPQSRELEPREESAGGTKKLGRKRESESAAKKAPTKVKEEPTLSQTVEQTSKKSKSNVEKNTIKPVESSKPRKKAGELEKNETEVAQSLDVSSIVQPKATIATKSAKPRKNRSDKPGLARSKATHVVSHGDSLDKTPNQLNILSGPHAGGSDRQHRRPHSTRSKMSAGTSEATAGSTIIQIPTVTESGK